jgi:cob(I)alamin adenosyltransferase
VTSFWERSKGDENVRSGYVSENNAVSGTVINTYDNTIAIKMPEKMRKELGLVQVYTGNGKGKTTAALGLALRALGNGLSVAMVQFMKPDQGSGEYILSKELKNFELIPCGEECLVDPRNITAEDRKAAKDALDLLKKMLHSGKYDLFIVDEINVAMGWGLVDTDEFIKILDGRPKNVEVVLTGRYAPEKIIEYADLVTEMKMIKHPYERGIASRRGIES